MFEEARPVWIESKKKDYNKLCGFLLKFNKAEPSDYKLNVAAADCYQCYLNGAFLLAGPARCAKGFFRMDSIDLGGKLQEGENILVFLVASYKVNTFQYADNDGFLQAEVLCGGKPLTCTDKYTLAFDVPAHTQKTLRYSFQRTFTEVWQLDGSYSEMLSGERIRNVRETVVLPERKILPRASRIPLFERKAGCIVGSGTALAGQEFDDTPVLGGPAFLEPRKEFKAFARSRLECDLYTELRGQKVISFDYEVNCGDLETGSFQLFDFKVNGCGFLSLELTACTDCTLYVTFDEILTDSDVDPFRLNCINCVKYVCKAGEYRAISLEPYVFRYAKIFCTEGRARIRNFSIREVANPAAAGKTLSFADEKTARVYEAALNTFRYNCVDILMDCPSRERAGWLCDGYFTGRAEHAITGRNDTEHDFLENFLLPKKADHLPKGMFPMCYPSEHLDGNFIPNWAMWFILELERYFSETGDADLVARAKNKIYALFSWFAPFENEYGLLERLPGWVFIEWSKAAEFTNDVNYPTNMLYALSLQKAGELYADPALCEKAEKLRETVRKLSYNGEFFADHAVRREGELVQCRDTSEVCQYYAFFTETATPASYPLLWEKLVKDFGPARKKTNRYPAVCFANAFIGNYLRLILLERNGRKGQLSEEITDYFLYMAEKTETLWENDTDSASCNHGFASYVICWIDGREENKQVRSQR